MKNQNVPSSPKFVGYAFKKMFNFSHLSSLEFIYQFVTKMNYIINEQKGEIYDIISYVHWTFQLPRYVKHDIHIHKLLQNSKNMTMDNIKECNCEGN